MIEKQLEDKCIALVKTYIQGTRQSNNLPAYTHSLRVYEILKNVRCDFYVQIAGLLHDILEDTPLSSQELLKLGIPIESIKLIETVTHDTTENTATDKWKSKIRKLINAQSKEAWSIATADMIDNMKEPLFLENEEKMRWYLSSKVAVILYYAALYLKDSPLFSFLLQEYMHLIQKVNTYDFT